MATHCAINSEYTYDRIFFGRSVDAWVQELHRNNCLKYNWDYKPLIPGMFGYDNLAVCIYYFCKTPTNSPELIHRAWVDNYLFWHDNALDSRYKRPYKPLGDDIRNKLAKTPYEQLDKEEQEKDIIIHEYLSEHLRYE